MMNHHLLQLKLWNLPSGRAPGIGQNDVPEKSYLDGQPQLPGEQIVPFHFDLKLETSGRYVAGPEQHVTDHPVLARATTFVS
jgi:hypothetical protein